jgi:hypothetical protein
MFTPNNGTVKHESRMFGLHRFKGDSTVYLCRQHECGDWITIRPAVAREIEYVARINGDS